MPILAILGNLACLIWTREENSKRIHYIFLIADVILHASCCLYYLIMLESIE